MKSPLWKKLISEPALAPTLTWQEGLAQTPHANEWSSFEQAGWPYYCRYHLDFVWVDVWKHQFNGYSLHANDELLHHPLERGNILLFIYSVWRVDTRHTEHSCRAAINYHALRTCFDMKQTAFDRHLQTQQDQSFHCHNSLKGKYNPSKTQIGVGLFVNTNNSRLKHVETVKSSSPTLELQQLRIARSISGLPLWCHVIAQSRAER